MPLFLAIVIAGLTAIPSSGVVETARVVARSANVRSGPSLGAHVVGTIEQGVRVNVLAWPEPRRSTWANVTMPERSIEGWVYGALLEAVEELARPIPLTQEEVSKAPRQPEPSVLSGESEPPRQAKEQQVATGSPAADPTSATSLAAQLRRARHRSKIGKFLVAGGAILFVGATAKKPSLADRLNCLVCEPRSNTKLQLVGLGTAGFGTYLWITGAKEARRIERMPVTPSGQGDGSLPPPEEIARAVSLSGRLRSAR